MPTFCRWCASDNGVAALLAVTVFGIAVPTAFGSNPKRGIDTLPPAARDILIEQKGKPAETKLPDDFDAQNKIAVAEIVNESFIIGFGRAAYLAAILALISTVPGACGSFRIKKSGRFLIKVRCFISSMFTL